jgi:hypothetical protein
MAETALSDAKAPEPEFKLSDAVTLFTQQGAAINTLWMSYATIALVTAGFVFATGAFSSQEQLQYYIIAGAVTVAFWLFTLGHLRLILASLRLQRQVRDEIRAALKKPREADLPFQGSLRNLADSVARAWFVCFVHLAIDVCVTVAIWSRPLKTEVQKLL